LERIPMGGILGLEADRVAIGLVAFDVEFALDDFELCHGDSSLSL